MTGSGGKQDAWVDAELRRVDPVLSEPAGGALGAALELAGYQLLRYAANQPVPRRRVLRTPRRLALIGALVLGASGAAAAATELFVNANTHKYATHEYFHHGGAPGEFLNLAGTNLTQVVKQDSARDGITFPTGRFDWRDYALKEYASPRKLPGCPTGAAQCKLVESSGSIDVNIAQVAFVAWLLQWRQAEKTHDTAAAREAAAVIAKAPNWKAIANDRRVDPLYEEGFYWLPPFVRAVAAGDLKKVDELIASPVGHFAGKGSGPAPYGLYVWGAGPDGFNAWWDNIDKRWSHLPFKARITHARAEGVFFLRYLDQHGS